MFRLAVVLTLVLVLFTTASASSTSTTTETETTTNLDTTTDDSELTTNLDTTSDDSATTTGSEETSATTSSDGIESSTNSQDTTGETGTSENNTPDTTITSETSTSMTGDSDTTVTSDSVTDSTSEVASNPTDTTATTVTDDSTSTSVPGMSTDGDTSETTQAFPSSTVTPDISSTEPSASSTGVTTLTSDNPGVTALTSENPGVTALTSENPEVTDMTSDNPGSSTSDSSSPENSTSTSDVTSESTSTTWSSSTNVTDGQTDGLNTTVTDETTDWVTGNATEASTTETTGVVTGNATDGVTNTVTDGYTGTSTSPTTTPTSCGGKDECPLDLDGAFYSMEFKIFIGGNDTTNASQQILQQFNASFWENVTEFRSIAFSSTSTNEGTSYSLNVLFDAWQLHKADPAMFRSSVDDAVLDVQDNIKHKFTMDYQTPLAELLIRARDICAATGDLCTDSLQKCYNQSCVHLCVGVNCGERRYCDIPLEEELEPVCICSQEDGLYERSGVNCDVETMKWQYVLGISAGVGGAIILILLLTIALICRKRKQARYREKMVYDVDNDIHLNDLNRRSQRSHPSDITEFTPRNQRAHKGEHAHENPLYDYDNDNEAPSGMSFLHARATQGSLWQQEEILRSFKPNHLVVDTETKFQIRRPQLSIKV